MSKSSQHTSSRHAVLASKVPLPAGDLGGKNNSKFLASIEPLEREITNRYWLSVGIRIGIVVNRQYQRLRR